jgi:histidinol-phosphate aminotransferase
LGSSPKALAALRANIGKINRYPDASSFYLRRKVAKSLGLDGSNLIFGNGSDEIIGIAARTFIEDGDEVVIAKPTFLIYEIASQIANARIKFVSLGEGLRHDLRAMKKAVTAKTKIVFIANPDNPTGTYVSKKELDEFFKGLPDEVIVFLDEAYFEFANYTFKDYPNGVHYLKRPNLVIARSFSKAYGLAGLRVGYGISSPEIIGYMERVREPFNVNLLAAAAADAAIDDKPFLRKTLSHVKREKESLYDAFRNMGLKYVESATNFVLVNVERDCKEVFNALLRKGIIVRDMKAWGLDTYIRVTVGTKTESRKFVRALRSIIHERERKA